MISRLDQRSSEIVHPDLGTPVTNRHEYLRELQISGDRVNRSKMSMLETKSGVDFHWFLQLLVGNNDSSLLCSNHELACSFRTVFQGSCSNHYFLSLGVIISYLQRFHSILFELSCIPEMSETVS